MNNLLECEILRKHQKTLHELSRDNRNCETSYYMTDCEEKAIDFDEVKNEYSAKLGISQYPKSVDAILPMKDEFVFIEFKNGCITKEKNSIRIKLWESLLIICDILNCTLLYIRCKSDFILVYNEQKNLSKHLSTSPSFENIAQNIGKLAKERKIRFGLEQLKRMYFRDVMTLTEKEFSQYLNGIFKEKIT